MSFNTLGLSAELQRAVDDQGYTVPTPIQQLAIPVILRGADVMARAQTGTGKTAGFTLPLLQRLSESPRAKSKRKPIRTLILTPTRELAAQVQQSVRTYGKYLPVRSTTVYGGVGFRPQAQTLRRGVDVLVATPGRLLDHLTQKTCDLSQVTCLVLDEADRMLDMGFIPDIKKILARLPENRQNLLFSATLPAEIRKLADSLLNSPERIEVEATTPTAERVTQIVHPVDRGRKSALLTSLIEEGRWRKCLVFARTKRGADRLTQNLKRDGVRAAAIHGGKSQGIRTRTLADFKNGRIAVLVATDIAARGLDIEKLPQVVNYDLPHVAEDYVHRIGRTARAGESGEAVSFVTNDDTGLLRGIERLLGTRLEKKVVAGFEPREASGGAPRARKPYRSRRPRSSGRSAESARHNSSPNSGSRPGKRERARRKFKRAS